MGIAGSFPDLHISFDVGHSSIGWAVLQTPPPQGADLQILGSGVVIFRADDCLASARRAYRRQRRHIRSTRQRIARLKILLGHLRVLTQAQLDRPGCAWPWLLAARVLRGGELLSWPELWDVLRWYAHNRGYDGNRRWSALDAEASAEDTEKEECAKSLMARHGVSTMAETFCAELEVDPLRGKRSSRIRFKGLNAAFPRSTVEREVRSIIRAHIGRLPGLCPNLERSLLGRDSADTTAYQAIPCPTLALPKRYHGGLLFGQLFPRFDNRIISVCPVTGEKVPSRNTVEFLNFRWSMLLANARVARFGQRDLQPLTVDERKQLDLRMRESGAMTASEFKKAVREVSGAIRDNLEAMLMTPDAQEALVLDPVQKLLRSAEVAPAFAACPERLQKRVRGRLRRGKPTSLADIRSQLTALGADTAAFDAAIAAMTQPGSEKPSRKQKARTKEDLLARLLLVPRLPQRAAYARSVLKKAYQEVMAGKHPKEPGGCLFITDEMRDAQLTQQLCSQTNNHLIRHRLLVLERLLKDILKQYAGGDKSRVAKMTIEVNRDLREMSGLTSEEKAEDLRARVANHHAVARKLEEDPSLGEILRQRKARITAGLIRKARVADDLDWTCPYTGQRFEPVDLLTRRVDKDHVIPRAERASDSLDSLVVTYSAINKWKGKRTALQFVTEEQGKPVPDLPHLTIRSLACYRSAIEDLQPKSDPMRAKRAGRMKRPIDDLLRKWRRKRLMLDVLSWQDSGFLPRDLTTTSQLVRLGAMALRKPFIGCHHQPVVVSLPGLVTGAVRKAWRVLGCLSLAVPQVLDECGEVRTKQEIRDITHLHHALDACVLGLASHFIPNNGRIWELLVRRSWTPAEQTELKALGVFERDSEGRLHMKDLPAPLKQQLRQKLAEKRVVQHVPARMDGLRVKQNTWRVVSVQDGEAILRQRVRQADGSRPLKEAEEKISKLLGLEPAGGTGKLRAVKGVLVIPENYGVAFVGDQPVIVPFHKVWQRLQGLSSLNRGKRPLVLRNGQLIRVPSGKHFQGLWRVFSAKNNATGIALNIGNPDVVRLKNRTPGHKINVRLSTLLKDGMEVLRTPLTGVACPTTSSV